MSIEIKVPFPKYEGMDIKKVTADIEKGYSVVEYGEKEPEFKKGDILYAESIDKDGDDWIILFDYTNNLQIYHLAAYCNGYFEYGEGLNLGHKKDFILSLAAPNLQSEFIDILAKEGKKWNDDTKEVEPIEKDILVPESIGIYKMSDKALRIHTNGDGLYISFNDNKQLLCFSKESFGVFPMNSNCYNKVQCKLTPCKREDLKEGDTAVFIPKEMKDLFEKQPFDTANYCKILDYQKYVYVIDDEGIETNFDNDAYFWYKVEPINK